MVDIQCAAAEIRRGKQIEDDRKKPQDEKLDEDEDTKK